MGCGKSKHAVETATTITKSTNSDGTKQTTTATATKTVKETTTSSSLIQKEAETSLCVEDTDKKPVNDVGKTNNVAPTLAEKVEKHAEGLKDVKVKDSNPTENAAPPLAENAGKAEQVVRGEEKVVPTSSKDDVATTEVIKEDEGKRESTLKADNAAKTANVVQIEENKMKESNLTKDNLTKTEFLTPTLSDDVVGPFEVTKGDGEVKDSKKETITATSDEKPVKTIDPPSSSKDDNHQVNEQNLVAKASESTKVEAKKEEDAAVTEKDIAKAKISVAIETEKVSTANEANVAETQEKAIDDMKDKT